MLSRVCPPIFGSTIAALAGYAAPAFPGSTFIPAVLGAIVFLNGGIVFIRGAWTELSNHQPVMMTLMSLAIAVASIASFAATLGFFEVDVWWELTTLITIMLLGHWLEMKAMTQARGDRPPMPGSKPDSVVGSRRCMIYVLPSQRIGRLKRWLEITKRFGSVACSVLARLSSTQ